MPHRKAKKPRGSRGSRHDSSCHDRNGETYHDLMVLLPNDGDKAVRYLKFQQITDRLDFLGYSSIALTHQVYGKPKSLNADHIFEPYEQILSGKKRKSPMQVYRRLHAVLENLSDVAFFTIQDRKLLDSYDLISLAPCNEAILESVCSTALVNMITLDYTRGGLPFKLRSTYVQAAVDRNIAFEVLYAPMIHHLPHRKGLIHTIRALEAASVGKKLQLIVSSGGETNALRSPGDIANVLETLASLDPVKAHTAQSKTAVWVLKEARRQQSGETNKTVLAVAFNSVKPIGSGRDFVKPENSCSIFAPVSDPEVNHDEVDNEAIVGRDTDDGFIML